MQIAAVRLVMERIVKGNNYGFEMGVMLGVWGGGLVH